MEAHVRQRLKEFSELIPRAVGTERASFEDRKWDYDHRDIDPDYWLKKWAIATKEVLTSGGTGGDIKKIMYDHEDEMRGK